MYSVIIQTGSIECDSYEHANNGVELYDDGSFLAFVPYANLIAVVDESAGSAEDRSIL